jgi:hypothetical protein
MGAGWHTGFLTVFIDRDIESGGMTRSSFLFISITIYICKTCSMRFDIFRIADDDFADNDKHLSG